MAGGPNAAAAPCPRCAELANRVSEGWEDDGYLCASCGYRFGMDFYAEGPPAEPMWPITSEKRAEILRVSEMMGWRKRDPPQ